MEIPLKLKIFKRTISLQIDVEAGSYQGETNGHTALGAESLGAPKRPNNYNVASAFFSAFVPKRP